MKRTRDRADGGEYVIDLAAFVREPTLRRCLSAIQEDCLTNDLVFTEDGKSTGAKFSAHIQPRFKAFARECIEYMHTCEFVPWYLERVHGEAVPRTLPLGSFTWQAQFKQPWELSQGSWPLKYVLRGLDFDIDNLGVRVFYLAQPLYRPMASPLDTLHAYYLQADLARTEVAASLKSSMRSLVLVSENVDTKVQTESGIDLLDASRRYNVGGATGSEYTQRQVLMSADSGAVLSNVNEAQMCWLARVQATHANLGVSLLPPNSQVVQVAAPAAQSEVLTQLQQHYRASVHSHFNVRPGVAEADGAPPPGAATEYRNSVQRVAHVLEDFLPQVYQACYKTDHAVACSLTLVNKLEIADITDVKTLCEWDVLSAAEVRSLLALPPSHAQRDTRRIVSFAAKAK